MAGRGCKPVAVERGGSGSTRVAGGACGRGGYGSAGGLHGNLPPVHGKRSYEYEGGGGGRPEEDRSLVHLEQLSLEAAMQEKQQCSIAMVEHCYSQPPSPLWKRQRLYSEAEESSGYYQPPPPPVPRPVAAAAGGAGPWAPTASFSGPRPSWACRFYLQGYCRKGDNCDYAHVLPPFPDSWPPSANHRM
jgi:hypothetical protein